MSVTMMEIEHYLAGTLDPERARAIEELAEKDAALKALLEERRALEKRLALDPRVKPFVALLEQTPKPKRWPQWIGGFAAAAAAAASIALFAVRDPETPSIRARGALSVHAVRLRDNRTERVETNTTLREGDRIQLYVEDPEGGYATAIWTNDQGHAEVLHKPQVRISGPVLQLPTSFEIDGDPGRETIYVVLCPDLPPDVDRWPEQLAKTYDGSWIPPGGCCAGTFTWHVE